MSGAHLVSLRMSVHDRLFSRVEDAHVDAVGHLIATGGAVPGAPWERQWAAWRQFQSVMHMEGPPAPAAVDAPPALAAPDGTRAMPRTVRASGLRWRVVPAGIALALVFLGGVVAVDTFVLGGVVRSTIGLERSTPGALEPMIPGPAGAADAPANGPATADRSIEHAGGVLDLLEGGAGGADPAGGGGEAGERRGFTLQGLDARGASAGGMG